MTPEQYKKAERYSPYPEPGKLIKRQNMDHRNYREFMNIVQNAHPMQHPLAANPFIDPFVDPSSTSLTNKNPSLKPEKYQPKRLNSENFHDFCIEVQDIKWRYF